MISDDIDGVLCTLEVVSPDSECLENGQQLLVVSVVIPLRSQQGLGMICNWVDTIIRLLGEDGCNSIV